MSTAIAITESGALAPEIYLAPAITLEAGIERFQLFEQLVSKLLIPSTGYDDFQGADYGIIPGTKNRSLFQPGAEKLALFFGLQVFTHCSEKQEDWEKGFFRYTYRATVKRNGFEIVSVDRSCHTREEKYAWIWVEAAKPARDEEARMKAEGIGRNRQVWKDRQQVWAWQERRSNPDPYSLQFVVEAMSQKRAYVAAVKKALAATGFFSTELDAPEDRRENRPVEEARQPAAKAKTPGKSAAQVEFEALLPELKSLGAKKEQIAAKIAELCDGTTDYSKLSEGDFAGLVPEFENWLNELHAAKAEKEAA